MYVVCEVFSYLQKGSNAILHAAYKNHYEIVSYLFSKGVNANECDNVPFLQLFNIQQGRNALHMACSHGANETVQFLLNNNAIKDINAKTNVRIEEHDYAQDKRDALLLSIEGNCSVTTVLELLSHGANVLTQTSVESIHFSYQQEGRNVLMECAKYSRTKLFHIFYRYSNINVNCKDSVSQTTRLHRRVITAVSTLPAKVVTPTSSAHYFTAGHLPECSTRKARFPMMWQRRATMRSARGFLIRCRVLQMNL